MTDYSRWSRLDSCSNGWIDRTVRIATLIESEQKVIEFGCGKMALKSMLGDSCRYTPSDIVSRSPDTLICDLNVAILPTFFPYNDVAIFSGVLEYIYDLPRLARWLTTIVHTVIVSYASHGNAEERVSNGWVNSYTLAELVEIFAHAGFRCVHDEVWQSQTIFKFVKV